MYEGRESGSLQWRQSRGEGGTDSQQHPHHVIKTGHVTSSFLMTYTPATDQYTTVRDGGDKEVGGTLLMESVLFGYLL